MPEEVTLMFPSVREQLLGKGDSPSYVCGKREGEREERERERERERRKRKAYNITYNHVVHVYEFQQDYI